MKLGNGTEGTRGIVLPEADIADMKFFIKQLRIVLPVLGLDVLRRWSGSIIRGNLWVDPSRGGLALSESHTILIRSQP
ncbi:hypothetical protein MCP1_10040 [Candidatus Terasakiella magnetica]|nr:hypothetical protein MCP1_10040 [Candidatus Terasakiella magnetica]